MRSRSSRLFIVLLHLVGVSTNLPGNSFLAALFPNGQTGMGIVGVNPLAILLEPLELRVAGGLDKLLNLLEGGGYNVDETLLGEPYWLQDDTDGTCLGPAGFSECGDATLWKIRRRIVRNTNKKCKSEHGKTKNCPHKGPLSFLRRKKPNNLEDEDQPEWEYAFELFDIYTGLTLKPEIGGEDETINDRSRRNSQGEAEAECMVSLPCPDSSSGSVVVGECASSQAWSWRISEDGALQWDSVRGRTNDKPKSKHHGNTGARRMLIGDLVITDRTNESIDKSTAKEGIFSDCVWRVNSTGATTDACSRSTPEESMDNSHVRFSVIQYQSGLVSSNLPRFSVIISEGNVSLSTSTNNVTMDVSELTSSPIMKTEERDKDHSHLPSRKRTSRDNASSKVLHPDLKTSSALVFRKNVRPLYQPQEKKASSLSDMKRKSSSLLGAGGYFEKKPLEIKEKRKKGQILHHTHSSASPESKMQSHKNAPQRPRKIPVHPYIAASKNGMYEDPLTGLNYRTDLSTYLGHDRKLSGRHTLMGVGIYYRTMLKIKVYGVALYVPKRDVLADAGFNAFASMNTEELQNCPEFYDYLIGMGSDLPNNRVDKTLFININMQLSVASIRGSLESDWKLLSPEHKKMLIDSTFKLRHADERMLQTIMGKENTSRCSCGQIAPDSYQADSTCCARGTELVFTWRKNGNLELRIDGRTVDIFPNPDVAKGIFYEYLRGDPISIDARNHFADGFPFLLAPLAQVKGVSSPVHVQDSASEPNQTGDRNARFEFGEMFGNTLNSVNSHTTQVSDWIQGNFQGGISNMANGSRAIISATQNLGSEVYRRRINMWGHMVDLPEQSFKFITNRLPPGKRMHLKHVVSFQDAPSERDASTLGKGRKLLHSDSSTKRQISDEFGVVVDPSRNFTHILFLYMVHLYLVLLLIVSLPDSYTIRLVVKRPSASSINSDNEEIDLCTKSLLGQVNLNGGIDFVKEEVNSTQGNDSTNGNKMKKALSYYL